MIKYFCDLCKKEISKNYSDEFTARLSKNGHVVEATVRFESLPSPPSTSWEICKNCLVQVVSEGEEV